MPLYSVTEDRHKNQPRQVKLMSRDAKVKSSKHQQMVEANNPFECINKYNSWKVVQLKIQNIKQSLTHSPLLYHLTSYKSNFKKVFKPVQLTFHAFIHPIKSNVRKIKLRGSIFNSSMAGKHDKGEDCNPDLCMW